MKNLKIYIVLGIIIASLAGTTAFLTNRLKKEKAEKELYQKNTDVLMGKVEAYKANDSLNVVSIGRLELKLSEYKKYRAEDLELISSLKVDKKRLEQITTAQTQTIYELKGSVRDSIIYVDNYIVDTLRCLDIANKWFDLHGCINKKNEFSGTFENRDSLVYVEHVVPKKFLFIKWGVKERKQEILSKNPNTKIVNAEYISIRK
jgi:hypothetical protein